MQSSSDKSYGRKPDEISIRNLILTIKDYILLILGKWYLLLIGMIALGALQFYSISKIKPTFPAKVVLMLRSQDVVNENKHMIKIYSKLINSRGLLEELFLEPIDRLQPNKLLINEYLNVFFEHKPEELDENIPLGFQFEHSHIFELSLEEKRVFKMVIEKVITPMSDFTDGFVSISTDEGVGFVTINVSTPTEEFSILLLERICQKAQQLLFDNTIFAPKIAYTNLEEETDSLANLCNNLFYELNKYESLHKKVLKDDSYNFNRIAGIENRIHQLKGDTEICQARYLAAAKQLKEAQVAMDQKTLLIQELERTYAPIEPYKPSAKRAAIKGAIMGIALIIFLIVLSRIYKNIVDELSEAPPAESN
jgi:hypothetical protein